MTTKRECEIIEAITDDMTETEYRLFIAWLSYGRNGSLWDCVRPTCRASKRIDGDVVASSLP